MGNRDFDVVIIGGSYAGLSAAMALGRAIRKVLIIDAGKPCNRQTRHSHNFITQDGAKPPKYRRWPKRRYWLIRLFVLKTIRLPGKIIILRL